MMAEPKRVLVIDDTELIRTIYRDRLSGEGYEVELAADGLEGVKLAVEHAPDLILLDLVMPRQNGIETLKRLKADPRTQGVPVVILSNRDDEEEIRTGLELGAVDYLKKVGASPAEVAEKIRVIVQRAGGAAPHVESWRLYLRDREADADALVAAMGLSRRFWCPACEQELHLELVADPSVNEGGHWFKARLVCAACGRMF